MAQSPDMPAPVVQQASLQYATPQVRVPWGPILFRPAMTTLICLLLAAVAAVWLALRHDPWREVAQLPSSYYESPPFTADGQVLTLDPARGANLWNPTDGSLIRNVLPKLDTGTYRFFITKRGAQILALPFHDKTAVVYDVGTGQVARTASNPLALGVPLLMVYPDGSRLMTIADPEAFKAARSGGTLSPDLRRRLMERMVWDLAGPPRWPPEPVGSLPMSMLKVSPSPDGARLLSAEGPGTFALVDAMSLKVLERMSAGGLESGFLEDNRFFIVAHTPLVAPSEVWKVIEIRSAVDGSRIHAIWLTSSQKLRGWQDLAVSPDAKVLLRLTVSGGARPTGAGRRLPSAVLQAWNLETGKELPARDAVRSPITFFPGSSRFITAEPATEQEAIFIPGRRRPLAILPGEGASSARSRDDVFISPDGRTIALPGGDREQWLWIYRRGGWDCPPSHLGALVFPQMWLLAALAAASVILLRWDAGRAWTGESISTGIVSGLMLAIALPLAIYALVLLCLGQYMPALALAPAGALVIVAIGLGIGSRFWRIAALCALAATLPYELWQTWRVWKSGIPGSSLVAVLDRHFTVPHLPLLIGNVFLSGLIGLAMFLIARSGRGAVR